jgi:putative ABC transport system permease protein
LMICTGIVFQQLKFVSEKDLGFNKENLLAVKHIESLATGESFATEAAHIPGIQSASWCTSLPPQIWGGDTFTAQGMNDQTLPINYTSTDENYITTLGVTMKIGRNFDKTIPGDVNRVILNEAAVKKIGWPLDESIIGKKIETPDHELSWEVAGVVADFNYWSLVSPIEPMGIFHIHNKNMNVGDRQFAVLRIQGQSPEAWHNTIASVEKLWKKHAGNSPFEYSFVDQVFAESFQTQQRFGTILTVMAALAILIAGLGLLGMIIYSLEQRTKEIGIRKVTGASVWNILTLISRGYAKLIIIAFLIGAPASAWLMQKWLQDFAYRITPSIWVFISTGVVTLVIAVLITGYHSLRAAMTNPVDVLKDE